MAKALIWTEQALTDLDSICEFIARDSPFHAHKFAQQIVRLIESIPNFPELGRLVPEKKDRSLRERIHGSYRIVYKIQSSSIDIVMIHHSAMLFPEKF